MNTNIKSEKEELTARLRQELGLTESDFSDKELIEKTKGTFVFDRIKLGIRLLQLWKDVKSAFKKGKRE